MCSSLSMRRERQLKELKERSHNAQNSTYGEMISLQYLEDQNVVSLHGTHVRKTANDVAMTTMCPPPYNRNDLPQRKCVLRCCSTFPRFTIPTPEVSGAKNSVQLHVYRLVSHCAVHGKRPFEENKTCTSCV